MKSIRGFSHFLVLGLFLTFSAIPGYSSTPLTIKIEKIGAGATAHSSLIDLLLTVSGGNSQNSPTCEAFFKTNNVEFSILADGQSLRNVRLDTKLAINSNSRIETVSLSPAMLKCRIKIQPYSDYYLLYSWEFTKDKVSAVFNLESAGIALDSKPFTLTNFDSIQPSISILEPQRGAKVQGEFYLSTSQSNSEFWNLTSSSVVVMTGLQSVCQTPTGMTEVRIGYPNEEIFQYDSNICRQIQNRPHICHLTICSQSRE